MPLHPALHSLYWENVWSNWSQFPKQKKWLWFSFKGPQLERISALFLGYRMQHNSTPFKGLILYKIMQLLGLFLISGLTARYDLTLVIRITNMNTFQPITTWYLIASLHKTNAQPLSEPPAAWTPTSMVTLPSSTDLPGFVWQPSEASSQ